MFLEGEQKIHTDKTFGLFAQEMFEEYDDNSERN